MKPEFTRAVACAALLWVMDYACASAGADRTAAEADRAAEGDRPAEADRAGAETVASAPVAADTPQPAFAIGDVPPPLDPMAWVKGDPVQAFKPGHVYVINFFATWCGSSREGTHRLSELANQHAGELTIVGISIREEEKATATLAAVKETIAKRREEITYAVAMDDPVRKPLYNSWMRAAGMHGVPTAFVIGKDGKLAYVGYMLDDEAAYTFQTAVSQALSGSSDLEAARALHADVNRQTIERLREMELMKPMREARAAGNYSAAVAEATRLAREHPEYEGRAFLEKLAAMLHIDEQMALTYAQEQEKNMRLRSSMQLASDTQYWRIVGRTIAQEKDLSKSTYEQAATHLQNAASAAPEDFVEWVLLARMHHMVGNLDRAIAAQEQAVANARGTKGVPADSIARLEATLAEYRKARSGS